jgi:hypothetical protein
MAIITYAKYISNITGKKERTSRKIIADIHRKYNKKPGNCITAYEFYEFTGVKRRMCPAVFMQVKPGAGRML